MQRIRNVVCLLLLVLLAGCKAQLYTGLSEREGNDMLAMLLDAGIPATKELNKDRQLTLFVPDDEVAKSIRLLRSNGYPRDNFSSVGDIFPKDGLISSPVEERARYTYSMSQELGATLSMIDGVITARVHVVLPQEATGIQENTYPSSAAVFIKYSPELILSGFVPKVKTLVSNSIEGLALDKITVTLFPADSNSINTTQGYTGVAGTENFLGMDITPESADRLTVLLAGAGALVLLALAGAGVLLWMFLSARKKAAQDSDTVLAEEEDTALAVDEEEARA